MGNTYIRMGKRRDLHFEIKKNYCEFEKSSTF